MRFKEFLLREEARGEDFELRQTLVKINDECGQILHQLYNAEGNWLYRGMDIDARQRGLFLPHRKERMPRDSDRSFNAMFNAGIELGHDIPMVRQSSVFATGSRHSAAEYSNVYFLFPKGDFKFIWSPMINDSYTDEDKFYKLIAEKLDIGDLKVGDTTMKSMYRVKHAFTKLYIYSNQSIERAAQNIKTNSSVVRNAFMDYNIEDIDAEKLCDVLEDIFSKIYTTKNLGAALTEENEILLYETNGYYAIPREGLIEMISSDRDLDGQSPEEFLEVFFFKN